MSCFSKITKIPLRKETKVLANGSKNVFVSILAIGGIGKRALNYKLSKLEGTFIRHKIASEAKMKEGDIDRYNEKLN